MHMFLCERDRESENVPVLIIVSQLRLINTVGSSEIAQGSKSWAYVMGPGG